MIKTAAQIMAELAALGGDEEAPRKRGRPRLPVVVEDIACPSGICGGPNGQEVLCKRCISIRVRRRKGTPRWRWAQPRQSTRKKCPAVHSSGARCTKDVHKTTYLRPDGRVNTRYPHTAGDLTWL